MIYVMKNANHKNDVFLNDWLWGIMEVLMDFQQAVFTLYGFPLDGFDCYRCLLSVSQRSRLKIEARRTFG
jgi:hypothetical protein